MAEATLNLIDNAIDDYTSPDAMRWTPDPPKRHTTTALGSAPSPVRPRTMWASIRLTMADEHGNVTVYFPPNRSVRRAMGRLSGRLQHRQRVHDRDAATLKQQEQAAARRMRRLYGRKHGHA